MLLKFCYLTLLAGQEEDTSHAKDLFQFTQVVLFCQWFGTCFNNSYFMLVLWLCAYSSHSLNHLCWKRWLGGYLGIWNSWTWDSDWVGLNLYHWSNSAKIFRNDLYMTYIVSSGALNSTPTNQFCVKVACAGGLFASLQCVPVLSWHTALLS